MRHHRLQTTFRLLLGGRSSPLPPPEQCRSRLNTSGLLKWLLKHRDRRKLRRQGLSRPPRPLSCTSKGRPSQQGQIQASARRPLRSSDSLPSSKRWQRRKPPRLWRNPAGLHQESQVPDGRAERRGLSISSNSRLPHCTQVRPSSGRKAVDLHQQQLHDGRM